MASQGAIQDAEVAVAVRLEWAHAQFLGQRQGLAVGRFSQDGICRLALGHNVPEEVQGIGFVASFLMSLGQRQGVLRLGVCCIEMASLEIRLSEPDDPERLRLHQAH